MKEERLSKMREHGKSITKKEYTEMRKERIRKMRDHKKGVEKEEWKIGNFQDPK